MDILLSYGFWSGASFAFIGGLCLGFKLAYGADR